MQPSSRRMRPRLGRRHGPALVQPTFRDAGEMVRGVTNASPASCLSRPELSGTSAGARHRAVGFSMARDGARVGLKPIRPAAIVVYSGALATTERCRNTQVRRRRSCSCHGDMARSIPSRHVPGPRQLGKQASRRVALGNAACGIDAEGLRLGGDFLRQAFAAAQTIQ